MSRRIEIELTSAQADGSWTWRAAGALKPRGVLDGGLLYDTAKPGDLVRAEADFEIEGIAIVSVSPPQAKKRAEPERIEVIGPPRGDAPAVTTQLFGKGDRRPGGRRDRDDRRPGDRAPGRSGPEDSRSERPRPDGAGGAADGQPSTRSARPRRERPPAGDHGPRPDGLVGPPSGARPDRGRTNRSVDRTHGRPERSSGSRAQPAAEIPSSRHKRLNPANTHRQAVMRALAPEEQAVADQVLRGGIPAVRNAIHLEKEKAAAEGRPSPSADSLLALAERLLPSLKAAEWRDRAEAAAKAVDEISLRDLRSVVVGADLAREDETRLLATTLREALERRIAEQHQDWVREITVYLEEGRVVRALRLAARPPDASTRLPAEVTDRLTAAAAAAMSADAPPERWLTLLEAVAASPVRREVKPAGLPPEPGPELSRAAHQQAGRVPALAAMLGITMPPPPGPARGGAATGRPGRARPPAGAPRRSQPAPETTAAADDAAGPADAPAPAPGI